MEFVCFNDWYKLPESAGTLFLQAEKDSMFFSRPWFENLTTTALDDSHTLLLACVVSGDNVLAILPLVKRNNDCLYSLKHRYTSLYTLLLADNDQHQILTCLFQGLNQLPFNSLLLEPIAENDSNINGLQHIMEASGFTCQRSFRFYNWILRVQGQSFKDYMAARPTVLRNTIARKQRKLEREHGYNIRLFIGDEVIQAMPDYHTVYRASWKANEQYTSFLDGMAAAFSKPGWSRLAILYVKGQPTAAQLWFVLHDKASIFRLSYDKTWKHYSLGSILTSFLMEYVIDIDQVAEVDFLTGNETYKQDWMSERRERWVLSCAKDIKPSNKFERFVKSLWSEIKRS
ncbi:MAG: GNAT family N-acetyltransferase [Anaerolineae bacterium]|nr:GNAT family N-acetyltransferase [Anaerolineae bacterium]